MLEKNQLVPYDKMAPGKRGGKKAPLFLHRGGKGGRKKVGRGLVRSARKNQVNEGTIEQEDYRRDWGGRPSSSQAEKEIGGKGVLFRCKEREKGRGMRSLF